MLDRISKLEESLKKYQEKAEKLEIENKQLKVNLQRAATEGQSGVTSGGGSMNSSFKMAAMPHHQENQNVHEENPVNKDTHHNQEGVAEFELRLPKKIINKK
jgi:hypothetical protein